MSASIPSSVPVSAVSTASTFASALDTLRGELLQIPQAEVQQIRLDLPMMVTTVLGVVPEVLAHRDAIVRELGEADAAVVDRLETIARAAGQAHVQFLGSSAGADLEAAAKALADTRARLVTDAQALIHRGLFDARALDGLRGGQAYKDQAFDVLALIAIFDERWEAIAGSTPMTQGDLESSRVLAESFARSVGLRSQAQAGSPASDLRDRAYTLLVRTYDEVRRVIGYLRWDDGDADRIAPSLWAGRASRRREGAPDGELAPVPAPTGGAPIRPGMPGADPFIRS